MNEAPLDVARRGYACWAAGDYDGMLELATPDFEFVPAIAAAVEGGSITGHDAVRRFWVDLDETWETFRISADDFREAGGRVMGIGRLTAKGRSSELELDQPIFTVLWFQGERIARMQSFLDESAARAAFERGGVSELKQTVVERGVITFDGREKEFRSPELAGLLDAIRATAPTPKEDS